MTAVSIENVKQVAFGFFMTLALVYLAFYLLFANSIFPDLAKLTMNTVDLPTYFTGIIYFASSAILGFGYVEELHSHKALMVWILAFNLIAGITILDLFASV